MISVDVVADGAISTTTCIHNRWFAQLLQALERLLWKLDNTFTRMICLAGWSVKHDLVKRKRSAVRNKKGTFWTKNVREIARERQNKHEPHTGATDQTHTQSGPQFCARCVEHIFLLLHCAQRPRSTSDGDDRSSMIWSNGEICCSQQERSPLDKEWER